MQPQPQLELAEIFEERQRIKNRLSESYVLDEVASERLKRRVLKELQSRNLGDIHKAALHHELAAILGTQGRVEDARGHLEHAERLGFERIAVVFTLAFIYLSNGEVMAARSLIESGYRDAPDEAISIIRTHQAQAGMVGVFMDLPDNKQQYFSASIEAARILYRRGIADLELTMRLDTACRMIRSSISHPILGYKVFAQEGEGILYRYLVKAPIDDLIGLNEKVLDALLENHDGPLDQELSICVTPWAPEDAGDEQEAYRVRIS
ncbi:hypothetical protein BK636_02040 [Pseudomonas chlororaphis]|uniref:hypothetical protein n=1 Tax=Pseudomonas chlororaphis TaxID=587753 RepID=UPI000F48342E|nr:hypothetical protein [Pseudomonas chlororaphis]ROL94153.1 hypothetical protein BK636_02040 [Pseudomonas chlororaphis]